jgi:hypothetical protein
MLFGLVWVFLLWLHDEGILDVRTSATEGHMDHVAIFRHVLQL